MRVDREVRAARRAQPLLVPARGGHLEAEARRRSPSRRRRGPCRGGRRSRRRRTGPAGWRCSPAESAPRSRRGRRASRPRRRRRRCADRWCGSARRWRSRRAGRCARPAACREAGLGPDADRRDDHDPPGSAPRVESVTSSAPIAVTAVAEPEVHAGTADALVDELGQLGVERVPSPGLSPRRPPSAMPRCTRFSAISRPMKPPPMTTAVLRARRSPRPGRPCPRRCAARAHARCRGSAAGPGWRRATGSGRRRGARLGAGVEVADDDDAAIAVDVGRPRGGRGRRGRSARRATRASGGAAPRGRR